jgi:misacylated tRNA(Ala) deacylase
MKVCSAQVKEVKENNVILNQTVFYPRGGGQPGDTGVLRVGSYEYKVSDTLKVNGEVLHVIEGVLPPTSAHVECQIEWGRRYRHMRYHTAIHVLSGIVQREFGAEITGGQIHEDKARVDFDLPNTSREEIAKMEAKANEIVFEGHSVVARYVPREEAAKIPSLVRTKTGKALVETLDMIRVVEILGFDAQADGGTHVKNTREIGRIRIAGVENKGKHNKRIEIVLEPLLKDYKTGAFNTF